MKGLVILATSLLVLLGGIPCGGFNSPRPFVHKMLSFDQRHVQHFAEGVQAGVEITSGHGRMSWSEQESAAADSTVISGVEAETDKIGDGGSWSIGEAIVTVSALVVAVVCLLQARPPPTQTVYGGKSRNSRAYKARRQTGSWQQKSMKCLCLYLVAWHCISETCNRFYTTTHDGQFLTRLNRRNGNTKTIGKWQAGNTQVRVIDTFEWSFPAQTMYGLELNVQQPNRAQRFVRINRQKPRGANINNDTFGLTAHRDLMGMAVDESDT